MTLQGGLHGRDQVVRAIRLLQKARHQFLLQVGKLLLGVSTREDHLHPRIELKQMAERAERAQGLDELLGFEGNAARIYFGEFTGLIKAESGGDEPESLSFDFEGRNERRGALLGDAENPFAQVGLMRQPACLPCASGRKQPLFQRVE